MAMRYICHNCGYAYRPRSANTCCPKCKHAPDKEEMQSQLIIYLFAFVVCAIVVAIFSAK